MAAKMIWTEIWVLIFVCVLPAIRGHPTTPTALQKEHKLQDLKNIIDKMVEENSVQHLNNEKFNSQGEKTRDDPPECIGCIAGVNLVQYYIKINKTVPEIISILNKLCVALNYGNPTFCNEYTNQIGDILVTVLKNTANTPGEVCSFVQNLACGNGDVVGHRWTLNIPDGKPPVSFRPIPKDEGSLKVLHITDTHFDPMYVEGARDLCQDRLCCRAESGMASKNESAAGKWGGWKCDIPERTVDNFLEHVSKTHGKFDYIIWTGDIPAHASWTQTRNESIYMLQRTVGKILKHFPSTPIFPAIGNHEGNPPNMYPSPALQRSELISWFYLELAKQWSSMLPKSTIETIKYGAFYVAQARPRLKIISLNTNYCYARNWWLILNSTDPAHMLDWLIGELKKAEAENVKVHIIAHVPPGYGDCLKIWGNNFYNIISRFESTVTAQFYGHLHTDEIEIYYDSETKKRPVSIGYVGPSLTTYVHFNPAYRIYKIEGDHDGSFYDVIDYDGWVMDLEKSNKNGTAHWRKLYSAKAAYDLQSLLPEDWSKFYERLKTNDTLLDIYDRHYWKDSPRRPKCGTECRRTHLFDMRSGVHYGPPEI